VGGLQGGGLMPFVADGRCFATLGEAVGVWCARWDPTNCYQRGSRIVGYDSSRDWAYVITNGYLRVISPVRECSAVNQTLPYTYGTVLVDSSLPQFGADQEVIPTCAVPQIQVQGVPNIPPDWAEVSAFCSLGFGFTFAAYLFAKPFGELIRIVRRAKG
jgi:hypothetical protein